MLHMTLFATLLMMILMTILLMILIMLLMMIIVMLFMMILIHSTCSTCDITWGYSIVANDTSHTVLLISLFKVWGSLKCFSPCFSQGFSWRCSSFSCYTWWLRIVHALTAIHTCSTQGIIRGYSTVVYEDSHMALLTTLPRSIRLLKILLVRFLRWHLMMIFMHFMLMMPLITGTTYSTHITCSTWYFSWCFSCFSWCFSWCLSWCFSCIFS